jgi:predicted RNA-binding Zn-ribbon protein involved in translation (DUF1610 family)
MKNSELLSTSRKLSGVEGQRQFILRMQNVKMPCPNCAHQLNVYEAHGVDVDDYKPEAVLESNPHCTKCGRALRYTVPFIAVGNSWHWSLVPIKVEDNDA